MMNTAPAGPTDRSMGGSTSPVTWLIRSLLLLLTGILLLVAVFTALGDASYLNYLASRGTVFDAWAVLTIASVLFSLIALVGAGFSLRRRKLVMALAFAGLTLPAHFILEASRCDVIEVCRLTAWAALPPKALAWQVRIRPVTDPNEARNIASAALSKIDDSHSPFKARRFADHWIVSAIDENGWPGPHAVRVDTRSALTSLIPCPADKVQCGMERPVVSDGRRVFRNEQLGLAAIFPASRSVCTLRGEDDAPNGFYAMVRPPDIPCDILDQSREMGLAISQRRLSGCTVTQAPSLAWRPLSPATAKLFRRSAVTIQGKPSLVCELRVGDQIEIGVYAANEGLKSPPGTRYMAYVVTTRAHLAEDIRVFESFMDQARIGVSDK